jgi:hypothetical protein
MNLLDTLKIPHLEYNSSWLDISFNSDDFKKIIPDYIISIFESYNKIPKEDTVSRKLVLTQAHKLLLIKNKSSNLKDLKKTISNVEKRINYFSALDFLFKHGILFKEKNSDVYNVTRLKKVFFEHHNIKNNNYSLRYPNREIIYDFSTNNWWGDMWLQLIDPAHRELDFYKNAWLDSNTCDNFFIWLEKQPISFHHMSIDFILNSEINDYKINVKNGLILDAKGQTIQSKHIYDRYNETLFVIDANQDIFITDSAKNIRHTSLSRGAPVLGGGIMFIEKGLVKEIRGDSGHYLFYTPHMKQTINIMEKCGIHLDKTVIIKNWLNFRDNETLSLSEFKQKHK